MESILAALKDTPIPTILVVAGVVFLLLSIAGQLAGRITVPPERQRQAMIIGGLLLVVGVALHVVPPRLNTPKPAEVPPQTTSPPAIKPDQPPQPSPTPPSPQSPPPTPERTTPAPQAGVIPSLNARVTAVRFFEADPCDVPPLQERTYQQRFPRVMTREIYTELMLAHPTQERRREITIQGFYRGKGFGFTIHKPELEPNISANRQESVHWFNRYTGTRILASCPYSRGGWSAGSYTVEIYINGEKVTSGSFEIYE